MKLDEARARQNVLIARARMADAQTDVAQAISSTNVDSAFAKLDRMERKITEKEATAQAYTEVNGNATGTSDEFADLSHKAAVDDQLAALKSELGL